MRRTKSWLPAAVAGVAALAWAAGAWGQQNPMTGKTLAEGAGVFGVALHPGGDVYVTQLEAGTLGVVRGGRIENALADGWRVDEASLPMWAVTREMPKEKWLKRELEKPGPLCIATNGTIYVAEQVPNGRILSFEPGEEDGAYAVARVVPVPWLDQEFQWRDLTVDNLGRLFVAGMDEVGSDFMKFGSTLMRDEFGDWWVIDFGPFARFCAFALSDRQDMLLLGDEARGSLSWWEVNRHIMMGGNPDAAGLATLKALAIYPDGTFMLGVEDNGEGKIFRMDPFSGQQIPLAGGLKSIGQIAMNRPGGSYYVTDPKAGKVMEYVPNPPLQFNEVALRQIVRNVEGFSGVAGGSAPAFMNTFFDRLQDAAKEMMPDDDSTHSVQFNLSDIAGKLPIVAGRIRSVLAEGEEVEEDPLESLEFFLLFPSKVVLTDTSMTPSLSFFSAKRKSGKLEQTKNLWEGDVGAYRVSGTNLTRLGKTGGGMHVPIVSCGMSDADGGGVRLQLSFLGAGVYDDYYVELFQSAQLQTAKLVVKSRAHESGWHTYEASFMEEATIEGLQGKTKEQISNLLVSGFGGGAGANRSIGWLQLGKHPAQRAVAFDLDGGGNKLAGAGGFAGVLEQKDLEMRAATAEEITETVGAEDGDGETAEGTPADGESPEAAGEGAEE